MALVTATIFIGCSGGSDTGSVNSIANADTGTAPTTAQCRQITTEFNRNYPTSKDSYEDYYSKYKSVKGSDGGKGSSDSDGKGSSDSDGKGSSDSGGSHNEGKNCLACHSFASGATVFTSLNAADKTPGAAGYKIQLNGIVFSSARGTGNSRSASFPSGNYTAHVIDPNGNIVNSSASLSHDASRRACNSCHSSTGNSGAPGRITSSKLTAPTAVTPTGAIASTCVSFNANVMPILDAKCKSCHGSNGNFTVTTANATYTNVSALKGSTTAGGKYLLDKGSNAIGHGGGQIISSSSAEYSTLQAWIAEGALNN